MADEMDKTSPNDGRVQSKTAKIRGKTYHYLQAEPTDGRPKGTPPRDTILLLHGFPDLSLGWRYQIPMLASLGLRVVVPDMLGYGGTDAPVDLAHYSLRSMADDMAELARLVVLGDNDDAQGGSSSSTKDKADVQILVGAHDWGCGVGWRLCLWHPTLVKAIASFAVPYWPPGGFGTGEGPAAAAATPYTPLDEMATTIMPWWGYQLQVSSGALEAGVRTEAQVRDFINTSMGSGGFKWSPEKGWDVSEGGIGKGGPRSPLFSEEEERFYVDQFMRHGLHPPSNWYRTGRINYLEELELVGKGVPEEGKLKMPVLFVGAEKDLALPKEMAEGNEKHFERFRRVTLNTGHWIMVEGAAETNKTIKAWLEDEIFKSPSKASL